MSRQLRNLRSLRHLSYHDLIFFKCIREGTFRIQRRAMNWVHATWHMIWQLLVFLVLEFNGNIRVNITVLFVFQCSSTHSFLHAFSMTTEPNLNISTWALLLFILSKSSSKSSSTYSIFIWIWNYNIFFKSSHPKLFVICSVWVFWFGQISSVPLISALKSMRTSCLTLQSGT